MSKSSQTILSEFVKTKSESAFREIVSHHMPLVYSTALRGTNQASGLAQEVAQDVFTRLAKKAESLPEDVCLPAWLFRQTCRIATNSMRGENRRLKRETIATEIMRDPTSQAEHQLIGELDEAMMKLPKSAREILILRFFDGQDHPTIGKNLGISKEAARQRANRALESLREIFQKRGLVTSTPVVIATLTTLNSRNLSAATTSKIASEALKSPVLKVGLGTTLLGFLAGVMGVSAVAGGIQLMDQPTPQRQVTPISASERGRSPSSIRESRDLIVQIKQICSGPVNILVDTRLHALLDEIANDEIPEFVESSASKFTRKERERCYQYLLKRWMESDPLSAMNYALLSDVSLLIKYENTDQHENEPNQLYLSNLSWNWFAEETDEATIWLLKHSEEITGSQGHRAFNFLAKRLSDVIRKDDGREAQLRFISKLPPWQKVEILKTVFGGAASKDSKKEELTQLLDYLPQIEDQTARENLRQRLWSRWALEQPAEMRAHLESLEGMEEFQARLALLGRFQSLDKSHPPEFDTSLEEREAAVLDAGLAIDLNKEEIVYELAKWHANYGNHQNLDRILGKFDRPRGIDTVLEESIRAKFIEHNRYSRGNGDFGFYLRVVNLALKIGDEDRRRELARAIFRNIETSTTTSQSILGSAKPEEPLRSELEGMFKQD